MVIHEAVAITGEFPVTISSESVIHPRAKLDSSGGPVNIGRRCIVSERTHIGAPPKEEGKQAEGSVALGDYVTVELGAVIETGGTTIGEGTTIGIQSRIGYGATVGKNCIFGPLTSIAPGEKVPDNTVIFGNGIRRQDNRSITHLRHKQQVQQIEALRKLIASNPAKFQ